MYILKRILISIHTAVFFMKIVKMLLLYENASIKQFVSNDDFQNMQYQRQAGYLKKLGINCISGKFCAQNTV